MARIQALIVVLFPIGAWAQSLPERAAAAHRHSGALQISADASRVNIGTQLPLAANGSGTRNAVVELTVEEGEAGGSVSSSGLYSAPLTPGTYHVVASSGSERARLAIEVFTVR